MNSDNRSNASFNASRDGRSSVDPNQSLSQHPTAFGHRARMDSTASSGFYNPNRLSQGSTDFLNSEMPPPPPRGAAPSAGYNTASFFTPGREAPVKGGNDERLPMYQGDLTPQDEGWDVYADFNNTGPRYSTAFGSAGTGYRQIPAGSGASKPNVPMSETAAGPVELVTVPALGAEWQKSELRAMTSSGKREARNDRMASRWRAFRRDEHGFCGIPGLSRRTFVWILFGACVVVGLILAFTIPRVPGFAVNAQSPLSNASNVQFFRTPANFSFDTSLNLQIDTHSNFIPLHFKKIHADVFDSDTNHRIAQGDVSGQTFPPKTFNTFQFPLTFNYTAFNSSDQTWNDVYNACRNTQTVPVGETRPPLKLRIVLDLSIAGLPSNPTAGTAINDAACPFELPTNSA
ncbi:hypothetical protein BU17DRAFT_96032 [Hysterangium stoloniferum]|nr:hypothetical protein BU17DRAFT_96032 [Hysterangium stoloniferum]